MKYYGVEELLNDKLYTGNSFCGIKDLTYIYHGNWADPEVIYKGICFNEHDITEIAEIDLQERFDEGKTVDDIIEEGLLTEEAKGMNWDNDSYDLINNYLRNPHNHNLILSDIEDMIWNMQDDELYEELSRKANEKYNEELEYDYCCDACNTLVSFALENESNLITLIVPEWGERALSEIIENASEDFSNLKEAVETFLQDNCLSEDYKQLCDDVLPEDVRPDIPYLIYVQNDKYEECYDKKQLIEYFSKMTEKYKGLAVVVFSVNGTEFKGTLTKECLEEMKKKTVHEIIEGRHEL